MKISEDFFEWTNPLWNWITALLLLAVSTYVMYNVGYAILRVDYISTILGILYCSALGWCSSIYCLRAIYFLGIQMKENDLKDMDEGLKILENLSRGNLHHWHYVLECADSIWVRAPFQVGQRVQLKETPVINEKESWGWLGSKHFLIKGALATVMERDFYKGVFSFGLHFDDETWVDSFTKKLNPVDRKSLYYFGEKWLSPVSYDQLTCEAL